MSQAIKTVTKFTDALDVASNTAIDKSTDSLKQLLKTSKLLSDSQVDTIKSAKGLQNVVESLGRKQARLDELQEQYNKHLEKAIAKGYTGVRLQRIETALQQRLAKRLNDLGISTASAANAAAKLQDELTKHKDLEKQLNKEITNLTSSASKAGKAVEDLGSRMLETAEKHLSVAAALTLLKKFMMYSLMMMVMNLSLMNQVIGVTIVWSFRIGLKYFMMWLKPLTQLTTLVPLMKRSQNSK